MSNIESTRSAYQAFATGDLAALGEYFTPETDWYSSDEVEPGGELHGRDAVLDMLSRMADHWTAVSLEPHTYLDADDHVIVLGTQEFTNASGSVKSPYAHILRFNADGKVIRSEFHADSAKVAKLQR
ncbi:nuclear transport factor 2 family protein [Mycolicibacillus parakoreensis]|uniref:Nuclear transport factor 2 family protein n=2 Tax=Mycobacteriaceae TaxID=1762 RepID=A0ABY3U9G5_9MYCO|nr:nuclear transport factor 2 family protein [Mycolicibacillus parakoreensis]MCV7313998.1 nuclear transport factor 2 family protein [Mycolicibacillus parakoreensis]ULN54133.1 nuclear transport factor 2 family protein [Mycolicibacillus parakoreensis]HLR98588.1 nuclear transport factor 2 family protein [Mycolicibacillus parakoreensis]